jgi:hypothetical protein
VKFKVQAKLPDLVLAAGSVSIIVVFLFVLGVPAFHFLQGRAYEATVRGNAATVQLAAETYAAANLGRYPSDPLDLVAYLPGKQPPLNPYNGKPAHFRGQIGDLTYRSPTNGQDYIIEAWGPGKDNQARRLLTLSGHRPR